MTTAAPDIGGVMSLLTQANPVFRAFATYACIVIIKTFVVTLLTAVARFGNKAFINPEDCRGKKDKHGEHLKPATSPAVERVRRCHLNDLENVLPFVLTGLLYVTTGPSLQVALWHFRAFAVSRIIHTVVYLLPVRQPSRVIAFMVGLLSTLSMAFSVVCSYAAF